MRKKFKLFSLIILLTVLILPFTVKAADEGGYYGGIIEITLPTVPEVGQQPIIVDPNEHINILSHQWINDTEHRVQLLVDDDVINSEYVGCHPCINTSSLRIRSEDIFNKFVKATGHDFIVVHAE